MSEELENEDKLCKYCSLQIEEVAAEGIECKQCLSYVHVTCLKRGSVPGGLTGDVFFSYTCQECAGHAEIFKRERMPWLQAIVLILFHIQTKNPGLARRGYFHWKIHIATFIDKYWDVIFPKDLFSTRKQQFKEYISDFEIVKQLLASKQFNEELLVPIFEIEYNDLDDFVKPNANIQDIRREFKQSNKVEKLQKKHLLPTVETIHDGGPHKIFKSHIGGVKSKDLGSSTNSEDDEVAMKTDKIIENEPVKSMDPMCHYNTSLNNLSDIQGIQIRTKLMGNLREESILSPYSSLYLKPYIRRDATVTPNWLQLLAEILVKTNQHNPDYKLPPRGPIDYAYIQPSHIPAVNSLCNQFFWPGIDLTECLQYPDFSCVALYRKLIIGFAFLVPDVNVHENYISFVFVRPGWRNAGIARFMVYHLIQTSIGKDITLHVSINNPAFFLYQKFGFKVEHVVQNFYDKYFRRDAKESKHAFFCRLER